MYCVIGSEHLKICAYLKGMGSQVKSFDEPNPIYDVILPLKLLLLKKTEPEWYSILINFMDHIEYRWFIFPRPQKNLTPWFFSALYPIPKYYFKCEAHFIELDLICVFLSFDSISFVNLILNFKAYVINMRSIRFWLAKLK